MKNIYWIGLHKDTPNKGEKTGWKWLDGTPYDDSLDLWGVNEPEGGNNEECVVLSGYKHSWLVHSCKAQKRIICKLSKWIDFTL